MADNQEIRLLHKQPWINRSTFFAAHFRRNPEQYYMKRWPNFDPHTIITNTDANGFGKQLSDDSRAPPRQPANPDKQILEYLRQFEAPHFTRAIDRYLAVRAGDLSIPAFKWFPYDRPPLIITIPGDYSPISTPSPPPPLVVDNTLTVELAHAVIAATNQQFHVVELVDGSAMEIGINPEERRNAGF